MLKRHFCQAEPLESGLAYTVTILILHSTSEGTAQVWPELQTQLVCNHSRAHDPTFVSAEGLYCRVTVPVGRRAATTAAWRGLAEPPLVPSSWRH